MKKNDVYTQETSAEPLSPIDSLTYARLTPEERSKYRPTNERHEKLPKACLVLYGIAALSLIVYIIFSLSPAFADFFNQSISSAGRIILGKLTAWIPFSLGEFIIWLLPFVLVATLIYAVRRRCDTWKSTLVFIGTLMSVVASLFSLFSLNFAAGYRGTTLDVKLGLDRTRVSVDELYETAELLRSHVNRETKEIMYAEDGFSVMPYTLDELNDKLNDAYEVFCAEHDFITHFSCRVKPVLLSEAMSYMHITGIYSFFTGEANINVNFPDYTIPYTAAHEMAHQRGIAREDEANFVAYLVCIGSDDPYIRYSGYMNMYEYVLNALAGADYEKYLMSGARLNSEVRGEMSAYSAFFKAYQDSAASKVSGTVNDTYLQSQGTAGTRSYGMAVDLAVAYYRSETSDSR